MKRTRFIDHTKGENNYIEVNKSWFLKQFIVLNLFIIMLCNAVFYFKYINTLYLQTYKNLLSYCQSPSKLKL